MNHKLWKTVALFLVIFCAPLIAISAPQTSFKIIHKFHPLAKNLAADGATPVAGLVDYGNGTFYGTAGLGGSNRVGGIYSVTGDTETWLYDFRYGRNGGGGTGQLIKATDNLLYGTNANGGTGNGGTLYRFSPEELKLTVLVQFQEPSSVGEDIAPWHPASGLIQVGSALYGTTLWGGKGSRVDGLGLGTVYSFSANGGLKVLHEFAASGVEGTLPAAGLTLHSDGFLYGMTSGGGVEGLGTIFKLKTDGTSFQVLHSFSAAEGGNPEFSLLSVGSELFGVTSSIAFKIQESGSIIALHIFPETFGDGINPSSGLTLGPDGALYGTTKSGGIAKPGFFTGGILYRLTLNGVESLLHTFYSDPNQAGYEPRLERLIFDSSANILGTCEYGGAEYNRGFTRGSGTVFKISGAAAKSDF